MQEDQGIQYPNSSYSDKPQRLLKGKLSAEKFNFRQSTKSTRKPLYFSRTPFKSGSIRLCPSVTQCIRIHAIFCTCWNLWGRIIMCLSLDFALFSMKSLVLIRDRLFCVCLCAALKALPLKASSITTSQYMAKDGSSIFLRNSTILEMNNRCYSRYANFTSRWFVTTSKPQRNLVQTLRLKSNAF